MPVDVIKIDKIFIAGLARDRRNQAIVAAVVRLAHDLGLTVVAEGVEIVEQQGDLARLGADLCQGFCFARPMSAVDIGTLIEHRVDGASPSLPKLAAF